MTDEPFFKRLRALNQGRVDDAAPLDPQGWDSIDLLDLIASIDEAYSVTIPLEQLHACTTVGELRAVIRQAGATS